MARLDKEKQANLEPKRLEFAKAKITELGYEILFESKTEVRLEFKGKVVSLFPYSGWHTGANIKDGRGLEKLLKQIKK